MSVALVVLIVLAALALLAVGGAVVQRRRMQSTEAAFHARVAQADHDLAAALAEDRGWEYERLEAAARAAFAAQSPGEEIEDLTLVEVTDRPGTDEDRAAFHVVSGGRGRRLEIARRGDRWGPAGG